MISVVKNFLQEMRWLSRKKLLLFIIVYLFRVVLTPLGREIKNFLFKKLKLDEVKQIVRYNSLKIIVRFQDIENLKEIFESGIYNNYIHLNKNSIVLDIGAHIGLFSCKVAKKVKKVIAVEPHLKNFELLKQNIKLNHFDNITSLNMAVGWKKGYTILYGKGGGATILKSREAGKNKVKMIKLSEIIKNFNLKEIDLLKMDVEGAEEIILNSSLNSFRKIKEVVMEIHIPFVNEKKIISNLERIGFKLKEFPYLKDTYILYGRKI